MTTPNTQLTGLTAARAYLEDQARVAEGFGSPFVAALLLAGARHLDVAPHTAAMMADWPGDRASAAVAMRFHSALHGLARQGRIAPLAALFRGEAVDVDHALASALAAADRIIAERLKHPTQTNEVGRSAAFAAALLQLAERYAMPVELLEIGASAGLNLNLGRYRHDLGGRIVGDPDSELTIAPLWCGRLPPAAGLEVRTARGVDLSPIRVADDAACDRLLDHLFVDQAERGERLARALAIARRHPPRLDQGHAGLWLPQRLERPQAAGCARVVLHSMVMQYLAAKERQTINDAIGAAGARADIRHPLAVIGLEWTPARDAVHLTLTHWPEGRTWHLADCDPYGAWIDWRG